MPTLMPWTTVEIGDLDVFAPVLPSLVVYTWYVDDEPESSVTYFWLDDTTGMILHELVLVAPVPFEEAVTRAQEEAPKRSVERIHVKHARTSKKVEGQSQNKANRKNKRIAVEEASRCQTARRPAGSRRRPSGAREKRVVCETARRKKIMDKDRIAGSAKVVKGKVKEAVGKAVGDAKLEAQGNADKIEGKVQNAVGGLKDTLRGK